MKYFITGATGFIGGRIAEMLIDDGHEVIALVRTPTKANHLEEKGIRIAQGDITDKDSMRDPMAGVDGVYHIAAWYQVGVRDNSKAYAINVDGTRNVLELMQELNIPKGVYTSTLAVFSDTGGRIVDESYYFAGKHLSEYDRTKWLAHYEVALPMMKAGLPLVIVQPGMVYGPGDAGPAHDVLADYLQKKLPVIPARTALCWGHVEDTARGHILAMNNGTPGEAYIIAGEPKKLTEALKLAESITGIAPPRLSAAPAMLKAMAGMMSIVERVVPVPENYSSEYLRVSAGTTYLATNAKAKAELGFTVRPLEEGLRETLHYEMNQIEMNQIGQ